MVMLFVKKVCMKNRFVVLHKAPRLKTSARLCRGCFEKLWFLPKVIARVMHPYESISLADISR